MSKRISNSLRLQLFCAVLISLLVGVIVFGVVFIFGNAILDKTVYGDSFESKMAAQQFSELQDYVEEEEISTDNLQRLNAWCSRGEKIYLTIYQNGSLIYKSHTSAKINKETTIKQEDDPDLEDPDNEYVLTLQGGVKVQAFLYYYAGGVFHFWMTVCSGLLAFLAFSMVFIVLINKKIAYIGQMKKELDILSGGQLEYPVTINGNDELGELASGIDQMRRSILRYQEVEKQMRSANSELITAMSHDLRTPLTSMLAYLEIVERKKYKDEKQMEELIHKSVGQTMRIKQMADKLFTYFLAYSTEWEEVDMEKVDADQLFQQILSDYTYALESKGMKVNTDFVQANVQINVNTELLRRTLDNMYSNLLKYADAEETIQISYKRKEKSIVLTMSNAVRVSPAKSESTGIGLITCRRIIEYHKGHFEAAEKDGFFNVTISIPIQE